MTRIATLPFEQTAASAQAQLEGIRKGLGFIPNTFATLANAPAALSGYLALSQALAACRTFPLAGRIAHRSWNLTV